MNVQKYTTTTLGGLKCSQTVKIKRRMYHSSVLILHSFASLSKLCAFTCRRKENTDTLGQTLLKLVTTACASPSSRCSSSPLNVLCRSAAARLCPCTSRWVRRPQPGAAPSPSPGPVAVISALPPAACAARLLHRTSKCTAGNRAMICLASTAHKVYLKNIA